MISARWSRSLAVLVLTLTATPVFADPPWRHGLALHGQPKYPANFQHFDYVNPQAPKGGAVRFAATGTFDTLNPYILKGNAAVGLGYLFDTLMVDAADEASTKYGLIAEGVQVAADKASVTFKLRAAARFHDGSPVTAEDVVFTFETLKAKGHPQYRLYYAEVVKAEALTSDQVRFTFKDGSNHELPQIVGQLPVLSRAYYQANPFDQTTLTPPVGSGPYRIAALESGRSITYKLDESYWAKDLPVMRGRHNFGTIRYDYYRDFDVTLEAFKAGEIDIRQEATAKNWVTGYDVPAVRNGLIKQVERPNSLPRGMQGFYFNIRKPVFADRRVREALGMAFDYEWSNRTLFFGKYKRLHSFFENSELAARDVPTGAELALLTPLRDQVPADVFTKPFATPITDPPGSLRDNLRAALKLLADAGWQVKDGKAVHGATGRLLEFEILLDDPRMERATLPWIENLKRLGVQAKVRSVDAAQYQRRVQDYDYDMVIGNVPQSLSPGNEQRDYWGSASADLPGGSNLIGIKNPAIDALIEKVIAAQSREDLVAAVRALDRVLLWNHYVVPHWYLGAYWLAYWDMFGQPAVAPKYALGLETWWVDQDKLAALNQRRSAR